MDQECPLCYEIIELIRERAKLKTRLGAVKNKIMMFGKKMHKSTLQPTPSTH